MRIMHVTKPLSLLLTLTLLSGAVLISSTVSADDDTSVVDEINITVPVSCTISGTGMNTHNANINNGIYTPDIGTTTLHAFCNDSEGFAIYAAGYTGNEVGGTNSNKLVGTVASNNATIETGLATTAGNPDVSNWAVKLAITQDSGDTTGTNAFTIDSAPNVLNGADASFSSYHVVPNEYTKVAHKDSNTDMTTNTGGVKLTTTYAAYISKTQPADTYSGQVKYTLVHPADADAPIEPVTIEDAMRRAGKTKYNGYYKIQDMNSTICSNVNQYSGDGMAEVIDVRDDNIYHIAKLADDNCWMLDNLALDPTDSTTASNMNASNTNATQAAIANLLNGGSSTTGWSTVAVENKTSGWNTTSPNNAYEYPYINNQSKDTLVTSYGPASTNNQAKVGIYYNYCAASASTYCYASSSGVDIPDTMIDAPQDVCSVSWRIPTSGEFYALVQEYGSNPMEANSIQYNLSMSSSRKYMDGQSQDASGYWWSSTYATRDGMENFYLNNSGSVGFYYDQRSIGLSIRCLVSD